MIEIVNWKIIKEFWKFGDFKLVLLLFFSSLRIGMCDMENDGKVDERMVFISIRFKNVRLMGVFYFSMGSIWLFDKLKSKG